VTVASNYLVSLLSNTILSASPVLPLFQITLKETMRVGDAVAARAPGLLKSRKKATSRASARVLAEALPGWRPPAPAAAPAAARGSEPHPLPLPSHTLSQQRLYHTCTLARALLAVPGGRPLLHPLAARSPTSCCRCRCTCNSLSSSLSPTQYWLPPLVPAAAELLGWGEFAAFF
jgi:hypothetical protein